MTDVASPHFLEDRASHEVRSLISDRRSRVDALLLRPGGGGLLNCLSATGLWSQQFAMAGVRAIHLGQSTDLTIGKTQGGYLVPGEAELRDHHWLAVGEHLALFDPTAAQYSDLGPPSLDRYITFDGRRFEDWRRDQLGRGLPKRVG